MLGAISIPCCAFKKDSVAAYQRINFTEDVSANEATRETTSLNKI